MDKLTQGPQEFLGDPAWQARLSELAIRNEQHMWIATEGAGKGPAGRRDMATNQASKVIQHFRRAVLLRDGAGPTDGQLLDCFLEHREEAAFAALVRRHGPMVWE